MPSRGQQGIAQKGNKTKKLRPAYELIPDKQAHDVLKLSGAQFVKHSVAELASLIWHHKDANAADIRDNIARAIEHLNSLSPANGAEVMLAKQLVGVHFAALESLAALRFRTRRTMDATPH